MAALACEARPLISRFRLKRQHQDSHIGTIYRSQRVALTVSGIGRAASAASVGYLHGRFGASVAEAWLNVGVAGHRSRKVADGFIVHSIYEASTGRIWHPPAVIDLPVSSDLLTTVDMPETGYAKDCGYDMEASGFYATAVRISTSELVQAYKVVSDSLDEPLSELNEGRIESLIESHLDAIDEIAEALLGLASEVEDRRLKTESESWFYDRWNFSFTQRARLRDRLGKLAALGHAVTDRPELFKQSNSAESALQVVDQEYRSCWRMQ